MPKHTSNHTPNYVDARQGCEFENPQGGPGQGGAKKRVNQLIQKFDKSAEMVTGGFVLQYGALIKENITFYDF